MGHFRLHLGPLGTHVPWLGSISPRTTRDTFRMASITPNGTRAGPIMASLSASIRKHSGSRTRNHTPCTKHPTTALHDPHTGHHASAPWGMARGDAAHHIVSDFVSTLGLRNTDFAPARLVAHASKATLPLTIPRRVFKSSAKDSTRRPVGNSASRRPARIVHPAGITNGTCLWGAEALPAGGRANGRRAHASLLARILT
ncbi:hypothetical protein Lal_00048561 [Lupinus albus]|nr:hypothetical protein Lal_00048561 [Lupinus albus]